MKDWSVANGRQRTKALRMVGEGLKHCKWLASWTVANGRRTEPSWAEASKSSRAKWISDGEAGFSRRWGWVWQQWSWVLATMRLGFGDDEEWERLPRSRRVAGAIWSGYQCRLELSAIWSVYLQQRAEASPLSLIGDNLSFIGNGWAQRQQGFMFFWLGFGDGEMRWIGDCKVGFWPLWGKVDRQR